MITDARSQGELIAMLHLESLFSSESLGGVSAKSRPMAHPEPAIRYQNARDAAQLRHRLEFIQSLAVSARGLSINTGAARTRSVTKCDPAARAAANIADWRTYLPEDCVSRMIDDGWHWST